jgi:AhpC/TSA family
MKFTINAKPTFSTVLCTTLFLLSSQAVAATIGQAAPNFSAKDVDGKSVSLADYKGKTVVLEWVNPGCPYVRKHYDGGNMQGTQKLAASKNVVWLAINSTEPAHQDYLAPAKLSAWMKSQNAIASRTLMDEEGTIGKAYGARTTPHMYIIDAKGTLVYAGGIDSIPSSNKADIAKATNYVQQSLTEHGSGKIISNASTKPYGCSIKYKS